MILLITVVTVAHSWRSDAKSKRALNERRRRRRRMTKRLIHAIYMRPIKFNVDAILVAADALAPGFCFVRRLLRTFSTNFVVIVQQWSRPAVARNKYSRFENGFQPK